MLLIIKQSIIDSISNFHYTSKCNGINRVDKSVNLTAISTMMHNLFHQNVFKNE